MKTYNVEIVYRVLDHIHQAVTFEVKARNANEARILAMLELNAVEDVVDAYVARTTEVIFVYDVTIRLYVNGDVATYRTYASNENEVRALFDKTGEIISVNKVDTNPTTH